MDESILDKIALDPKAEAEMDGMLAEMKRLNTHIEANQRKIEALRAESQRLAVSSKAILAEIQATF